MYVLAGSSVRVYKFRPSFNYVSCAVPGSGEAEAHGAASVLQERRGPSGRRNRSSSLKHRAWEVAVAEQRTLELLVFGALTDLLPGGPAGVEG